MNLFSEEKWLSFFWQLDSIIYVNKGLVDSFLGKRSDCARVGGRPILLYFILECYCQQRGVICLVHNI